MKRRNLWVAPFQLEDKGDLCESVNPLCEEEQIQQTAKKYGSPGGQLFEVHSGEGYRDRKSYLRQSSQVRIPHPVLVLGIYKIAFNGFFSSFVDLPYAQR